MLKILHHLVHKIMYIYMGVHRTIHPQAYIRIHAFHINTAESLYSKAELASYLFLLYIC